MSNELVKLREMLCEIFGNVDSYLIVARDDDQAYTSLEANDDIWLICLRSPIKCS